MDHVINAIEPYLEVEFDEFVEEWKTKRYKKYSDAPSYSSLKALVDSTNILRKYLGWQTISIKSMLEFIDL